MSALAARRLVSVVFAGLGLHALAVGQVQVEPGVPLQAVPFSTAVGYGPAFPPPGDTNFPAYFYALELGTGPRGLLAFDANGNATVVATINLDSGRLDFARGSSPARLFVTEVGFPYGVAPDGVYEISPTFALSLFNNLGGGNPDPRDVEFAGGPFGDFLLAASNTFSSNPNFDETIVKLTGTGAFDSVFYQDSRTPNFFAVSVGGAFGDHIYCTYRFSNAIDRIAPDGTATPFATLVASAGVNGQQAIGFGRGGAFGSDLYVNDQDGDFYRIDASGNRTKILSGISSYWAFDPSSGDLFVPAGQGFVRVTEASAIHVPYGTGCYSPPLSLSASPAPVSTATTGTTVSYAVDDIPDADGSSGVHVGATIVSFGGSFPGVDLGIIGAPGCNTHIAALDVVFAFFGAGTSNTTLLDIPPGVPAGTELFVQAIAITANGLLNPAGLTTSNGVWTYITD